MQPPKHLPSRDQMIEAILRNQFPTQIIFEAFAPLVRNNPAVPLQQSRHLFQAGREKLQALPDSEIHRQHTALLARQAAASANTAAQKKAKAEADAAAKEAAQFYNQSDAQANFLHWSKAEYWTFDEAIALLLGKSPKVLTPDRVQREIRAIENGFFLGERPAVPPLLTQYEELRDLARRATVMNRKCLHPATAFVWAQKTGAVTPPLELMQLLEARAAIELQTQRAPLSPPSAQEGADTAEAIFSLAHSEKVPSLDTSISARLDSPVTVKRSTKDTRRDLLTPLVEFAQTACRNPWDAAEVWNHLSEMAQKKTPPLLGQTEDGIQYIKDTETVYLSRDALKKRLKRAAAINR